MIMCMIIYMGVIYIFSLYIYNPHGMYIYIFIYSYESPYYSKSNIYIQLFNFCMSVYACNIVRVKQGKQGGERGLKGTKRKMSGDPEN